VTELARLVVEGVALGGAYGLVALGFVVIAKATGVVNFAQGTFLALGAYLTYNGAVTWGLWFPLAAALAVAASAGAGAGLERLVVRRLAARPPHAAIMATIGVAVAGDQVITMVWGFDHHPIGDPWGASSLRLGGVSVATVDVAVLAVTVVVVAAGAVFFARSRLGLAMRARAADGELAVACGIPVHAVDALAWALGAGLAALAGVLLAAGTATARPDLGLAALRAFPAVILAGFASVPGALVGGLVVGLVEVLTAGYAPVHAPWLGVNVHQVAPYAVMLVVLWLRPAGLFTASPARRW